MPDAALIDRLMAGRGNRRVIDLALGLHMGIPHGPVNSPYLYSMIKLHGDVEYAKGAGVAADMFSMSCHVGTHFDAIGHISCDGLLHGGVPAADVQSYDKGLARLGVEELEPIATRGVLTGLIEELGLDIAPAQ